MKKTKRFLALLVSILLLVCSMPLAAVANDDYMIRYVTLFGVQSPVAGEALTYECDIPAGEMAYGVVDCSWVATSQLPTFWTDIDNGHRIENRGTVTDSFAENTYYTFIAYLGASFDLEDAVVTINNMPAMVRAVESGYEVAVSFYVPASSVPDINNPVVIEGQTTVTLDINKVRYSVNGVSKISDSAPVIVSNRTFVPFRLIAEALGGEVTWVADEQCIITRLDDITMRMWIGSVGHSIYSEKFGPADGIMDVAPYINSAGRTMVPLRFAAESFGCTVTPYYAADGTTERVVFTR